MRQLVSGGRLLRSSYGGDPHVFCPLPLGSGPDGLLIDVVLYWQMCIKQYYAADLRLCAAN